jgi:N,N'-diacetylchitobiose transport system permease protein
MVDIVKGRPGGTAPRAGPGRPAGPGVSGPHGPRGRRGRPVGTAGLRAFVRRHRLAPYLLLLPSAAAIGLVLVWPTLQIGVLSLQNYGLPQVTGAQPSRWVGLGNYAEILRDPEFWLSLRISLVFAVVVVCLTLVTGTLVGLLLNRLGPKMSAFVGTTALLAWATPVVSASVIFFWLFDPDGGVVDWALARMPHWLVGTTDWAGFNWTTSALPAYTLLTLLLVWQGFPFIAVTVLAGLKTIPAELHESARVDGAGSWRVFWRITYPLLKPVFLVLLLLSIIWDFGVFTQAYLITGALGNRDEYNLGIYAYAKAFQLPPSYGLGSALALILTLILLVITVGYVRASIRQGATA